MTAVESLAPSTQTDYLGLTVEQRYHVVSQRFPSWLLTEPIEFPPHHETFGWACRVEGCGGCLSPTETRLICISHAKEYRRLQVSVGLDEFVRNAVPVTSARSGWALSRRPDCAICGSNREAWKSGYCKHHGDLLAKARRRTGRQKRARDEWVSEARWRELQRPMPPYDPCSVPRCVHDSVRNAYVDAQENRLCDGHIQQWDDWLTAVSTAPTPHGWDGFMAFVAARESVSAPSSRGLLSLAVLPYGLQNEIRYALHRHANNARRTVWRPAELQKVIDTIAASGVTSLCDSRIDDLAEKYVGKPGRRIWLDLPAAARSLIVTEDIAKAAGWFDPILVGSSPFAGTTAGENRRRVWDLTGVSQGWLRDVLWEFLRDEALKPAGKRPTVATVRNRIAGIALLSQILWQNRNDHGDDPTRLGRADAKAFKDTWDLWFRDQIPIPRLMKHKGRGTNTLTDLTRHTYTVSMRAVLRRSHEKRRTPPGLDSFILGLPRYPQPVNRPRPRPLNQADFQLLISTDSIAALEALDSNDVGIADIWLTQAFQGGRISETLKLRLGCVGLVGRAQPYIWRDISKVNVVDWGMPCYLPVYERLLRRQDLTRAKLRARYSAELAALDGRGRAQLEASWDRDKPLFPAALSNPDLALEVSQTGFRNPWTQWFESLGLKWITTHQTRSTLAMSLLDNGAPPALVRQVLGHFSEEALAHYARYNDATVKRHLQQVWAAGPGMDKPGAVLLRPDEINADDSAAAAARIDLTIVPVEHGLCRYGPVVGGTQCPWQKNCTDGPDGPCEHFVLTGADLAYWERKRDRDYHFAERAPSDETRDYILSRWHPWEPVLTGLREALDELGLLEEAEKLDLRAPVHDYFDPLFSAGFPVSQLIQPVNGDMTALPPQV